MEKHIKNILLSLILIILVSPILFSQESKRSNIWYFGRNAGINFNTDPPSPLFDGAMNMWEGCATICNTSGNIMLYTDGRNIWNANHQVIPGATNLGGNNSATQSGIIVPVPNSDNLLYVFSVDEKGGSGGFQYSIVDISQNGGLGGLVSKNNILIGQCSEKVTAIPKCNKQDFWLISHSFGNNSFIVWEITDAGISPSPNIIPIGTPHSAMGTGAIGYLKSNPGGTKLALGVHGDNFFEIFDFDNETGMISNPILLVNSQFDNSYSVEFSPDGKRLYLAGTQNIPYLYQVNLDLDTNDEIKNSLRIIALGSSSYFGSIQNGPDGKMYIAKDDSDFLSVVHNPNELGAACNFAEDDFYLGGRKSALGLPNLIPSFFAPVPTIELTQTHFCDGTTLLDAFAQVDGDSIVYQWYFNNVLIPNETSDKILVSASGLYEYKTIVFFECQPIPSEYSDSLLVTIPSILSIDDVIISHPDCSQSDGSITIMESGGTFPFQYSLDGGVTFQSSSTLSNLEPGIYDIVIQDINGCQDDQTVELTSTEPPTITDIQLSNTSCGDDNGSIIITATNGTGNMEYSIDGLQYYQNNSFSGLQGGVYFVNVQDSLGCNEELIQVIESSTSPSISAIETSPSTCEQDNGSIELSGINGNPPYQFSIDGTTFQPTAVFQNLADGEYGILINDSDGCADTGSVFVIAENSPFISNIDLEHTTCGEPNGSINIEAEGGTGIIQYSIEGPDFNLENEFGELEAGVYTVQIIDENMCTSRSNVVIAESQKLNILDIANIKAACGENNGAISVDIEGGAEPIQISLNDGIPQLSFSFYDLTPGTYEIHIMDDAGCKNDTSLTVLEEICPIYIPNAFSPNGDGINDQFRIYPHPEFKGEFLNLKIFDRWGSMIFEANDFASDGISWDGLYKGQKLNPAVFVYVIEIMHSSGMIEIRDGDITLLR